MFGGLHSPQPLPSEDALVEVARAFTPRVEALGATPVLLDLHGLGRVWPDPGSLGAALLERARAYAACPHVTLASTRSAALVLVRVQPGLTIVPPGREAETLSPLPLAALELDPERAGLLQRWGLRCLGDLARLPARGLAERFGPDGPRLRRLARGEDEAPLVPTLAPERFELALELEWPVDGLEPLSFLLGRVLEPLCERLRARGRRATGMELELSLVDGSTHRRALRPATATAAPRTWRTLLLLDLETHPPHDAIRALGVRAEPTPARTTQFSLLDPALPSPERLAETLGRLHEWTSAGRGGAASLLDTHRPGAFLLGSFAPGPLEGSRNSGGACAPAPRLALRPFRPPLPAAVTLEAGAPRFVEAPGVRGSILDRAGPWRASGDWWDVAWSREEWDVALAGGGLYRIYRDRLRERWFVEGELD